jgi:hypothetical protein
MRETMDKVTDRVLGQLYDLTDGADWPSLPDAVDEVLDEMSDKTRGEMWDWKRDIVKAAVAEIVARIAQDGESWVKILDAVLESETETIVATLEGDNDYNLGEHDSEMLAMYASDTGPDHDDYLVTERAANPYDTAVVNIADAIAAKTGSGRPDIMRVKDSAPGCSMVTITMPLSDARELAR